MVTKIICKFFLLVIIIYVRPGEFFSAKFVPLDNSNKIQKSGHQSFGENSLSVNNDAIQEIEADSLFNNNNNGKVKGQDDSGSGESRENRQRQLLSSSDDLTSSITSNKALYEKMLYSQLNALKSSKYPLSMETYFFSWINFKKQHSKKYESFDEEKKRFQTYVEHHEFVRVHNLAYDLGLKSFTVALNKFSDMTSEEFVNKTCGYKQSLRNGTSENSMIKRPKFMAPLNFKAPQEVDWRQEGYVTPVKDQGHCGSCWAFSATGALEGQHKRKLGTLISLSEQNLVDCSFKFGNEGCNGGLMDNAFQYIKQNHGVDTEKAYPYEATEGKCRFKKAAIGADDTGFFDVEQGNETSLKLALASQGPISVAIDAGHKSFQFYSKGVYFEPECSSTQLDHGVLAVGYGTVQDGKDYWIIKNSWGPMWGDDGYIKIARNRDNHCGVATQASYPIV